MHQVQRKRDQTVSFIWRVVVGLFVIWLMHVQTTFMMLQFLADWFMIYDDLEVSRRRRVPSGWGKS